MRVAPAEPEPKTSSRIGATSSPKNSRLSRSATSPRVAPATAISMATRRALSSVAALLAGGPVRSASARGPERGAGGGGGAAGGGGGGGGGGGAARGPGGAPARAGGGGGGAPPAGRPR